MTALHLRDVESETDGTRVLNQVSFEAEPGEFVALIGASGAGKTSIVRAVAGFDTITSGAISFDDREVTRLPPEQRDIGLVTQETTLFPTHRVGPNVAFPLFARAFRRSEVRKRVDAETRALGIDHILDRWPAELSGGEQKLAHIARALVRRPAVFLMDEPLAGLDPPTKHQLRSELVRLQKGYGVTTLYVATRAHEIMTMPDKVVAVEGGRTIQVGTPAEVFDRPFTPAIAELTGPIGWLRGELVADDAGLVVRNDDVLLRAWSPALAPHRGNKVVIGVRPKDIVVTANGSVAGIAGGTAYDRSTVLRELATAAGTLLLDAPIGRGVSVRVSIGRWHAFDLAGRLIATQGGSGTTPK